MKYLIYFISIVVILGLNIGFFDSPQLYNQIPNFLFLFAICYTLDNDGLDFVFISFVSGLLLDFFSTGFFGGYTIGFLIVNFVLYLFINKIMVIEVRFRSLFLCLLVCLIFYNIIIWFFDFAVFKLNLVQSHINLVIYIKSFPVNFLYNVLFVYPIYLLANNLKKFVDNLIVKRRGVVR